MHEARGEKSGEKRIKGGEIGLHMERWVNIRGDRESQGEMGRCGEWWDGVG